MTETQARKQILLVDDDPDYCKVIGTRLDDAGFHVTRASNGIEAIRLLDQGYEPDLILLDIDMPEKDGLSTLMTIHINRKRAGGKEKKDIPILVATGLESKEIELVAKRYDTCDYMRKPLNTEELLEKINALIDESEMDV